MVNSISMAEDRQSFTDISCLKSGWLDRHILKCRSICGLLPLHHDGSGCQRGGHKGGAWGQVWKSKWNRHFLDVWFACVCFLVTQLYLTLCDPMDCSPPGSSIHGIFQVKVLEWIAIGFSRGSSQPRDGTWVSRIVGRRFTVWANRELCSFVEGYDILNIAIHPELQI